MFQVRPVRQELQVLPAPLVDLGLEDNLDHLGQLESPECEVRRDRRDRESFEDLQDFRAAQVCCLASIINVSLMPMLSVTE